MPSAGGYVPPPAPASYGGAAYGGVRTDGLAIGALIVGIFSIVCAWVCLGIILGPTAAIMGYISSQRIKQMPTALGGGGLAMAGLITGIIGTVLSILVIVWFVFQAATNHSTSSSG